MTQAHSPAHELLPGNKPTITIDPANDALGFYHLLVDDGLRIGAGMR